MGSRYVEVGRRTMIEALQKAGFTLDAQGRELVAVRQHHLDPTMLIKIYTSMPAYAPEGGRPCGQDAIRVVLLFNNPHTKASGCLYKAPRVFRTGTEEGVVERMLERARDAYRVGNQRARMSRVRESMIQQQGKAS